MVLKDTVYLDSATYSTTALAPYSLQHPRQNHYSHPIHSRPCQRHGGRYDMTDFPKRNYSSTLAQTLNRLGSVGAQT